MGEVIPFIGAISVGERHGCLSLHTIDLKKSTV